jgi:hypothetical protein
MANGINPKRIADALQALRQAEKELEAALDEAERPLPNPPLQAAKVRKRRQRPMRRVKD